MPATRDAGRAVMICGTASDVGKSRIVTGLCRVAARRGLSVAPFKGQNMALNSVATPGGAEIGRAQAAQAHAAGIDAEAAMNPVLLKPTGERRSQVVVMGRPWRTLDAAEYREARGELLPVVRGALDDLRERFDVVVMEGAGSPAEVNLHAGYPEDDLVNLGLARWAGARAFIVGDIDRGGVLAHFLGTVLILPPELREPLAGFIANKFRGDPDLMGSAFGDLAERTGLPTMGMLPWLDDLGIDAEDSHGISSRSIGVAPLRGEVLDVAVVRFPGLSNFTDLDPLRAEGGVRLRWVTTPGEIAGADLVILPGTKRTIADLDWLRQRGLEAALGSTTLLGICGGYQMLGEKIADPTGVEASPGTVVEGLGWLAVSTTFEPEKIVRRIDGARFEIHHGRIEGADGCLWSDQDGARDAPGRAFGTSFHGLFEDDSFRQAFLSEVALHAGKAWVPSGVSFTALREAEIDRLADACEKYLDVDEILR